MSDDRLKNCWRAGREALRTAIPEGGDGVENFKRHTALERLERRYRFFMIMALAFVPLSVSVFSLPEYEGWTRWALTGGMACYFLLCSWVDSRLLRQIRSIDVLGMPTTEVLARAVACRRTHLRSVMLLLPLALLLVGFMAWGARVDEGMLWSMGAGAAAGLLIGGLQLRRFLRDYRAVGV